MFKDPVCGMEVENERLSFDFEGKRYFFCSKGCLEKFKSSPRDSADKYIYDLLIIGAGPAGLTASIYASVLKIDTFLFTRDFGGQAIASTGIQNYMGFDFISGKDLIRKFERQFLSEHYLAHKIDEVIEISRQDEFFEIRAKETRKMLARCLIIATGMKRRALGIPGEERLLRRGVFYNLVQDVALFKGADVVVAGGGNSGVQVSLELKNLGCRVWLISKGKLIADAGDVERLKSGGKVEILEGFEIAEIRGKDKVESAVIKSVDVSATKEIPCKGVFIEVGFLPNTEFCRDLVELNEKGEIKIKPDCSTGAEGIFACGDVTDCFGKRIIIASGEGAKAALSAKKYLLSKAK